MTIQQKFGLTLRKLRGERSISQEKFALQIGMDRTYYASVESGKRNISIENIAKIAAGFHISISELFSLVETIDKAADSNASK